VAMPDGQHSDPRDGLVSTYSARVAGPNALGWDDVTLGVGSLTHTGLPLGVTCKTPLLESTALGEKVVGILFSEIPAGGSANLPPLPETDGEAEIIEAIGELRSWTGCWRRARRVKIP